MSLADEAIVVVQSDHDDGLGARRMIEKGPSMNERSLDTSITVRWSRRTDGVSPRSLALAHRIACRVHVVYNDPFIVQTVARMLATVVSARCSGEFIDVGGRPPFFTAVAQILAGEGKYGPSVRRRKLDDAADHCRLARVVSVSWQSAVEDDGDLLP